jgi:uncharacterized protein
MEPEITKKVVIDTCAIVASLISKNPNHLSDFLEYYENNTNEFELYSTIQIYEELKDTLVKPKIAKYLSGKENKIKDFLIWYNENFTFVEINEIANYTKDKDDDIYFELCLKIKADYLVSLDKKHILILEPSFKQPKIVTPGQLVSELKIR